MPLRWDDAGLTWDATSQSWPDYPASSPTRTVATADLRVGLYRAGRDPVDLSNVWDGLRWSTNAVGGFGSATISLPGLSWLRLRAHTALLRVTYGPRLLFEGEVEDVGPTLTDGGMVTTLEAYGLARRFDNTLRRVWVKRNMQWQPVSSLSGLPTFGTNALQFDPSNWASVSIGAFDSTDLSRQGVDLRAWSGFPSGVGSSHAVQWYGDGITLVAVLLDVTTDSRDGAYYAVRDSLDGSAWNNISSGKATALSSKTLTLTAGAQWLQLIGAKDLANANIHAYVQYENIRVLSAIAAEDAPGGFYGGTILTDLVSLVPDIGLGVVERGDEFLITSLERSVRNTYRGVLDEVTAYYAKEWAVWEGGRFDWKAPPLDEPQWYVQLGDLSGLDLRTSVDGLHKNTYVLYTSAATGYDAEATVVSVDQRNPYVRTGDPHDGVVQAPFPMTALTSAQLAARVNVDFGSYPDVTGKISLPLGQAVRHASGATRPAYTIRAGDNIRVIGLPVDQWLPPGRDGQSFFHVASTDVDVGKSQVDLTLQGQSHRTDQLLARLAAVTRRVTG